MKKTLVVILNHNTPEITDRLYEELESHRGDGYYDLVVIDNGSPKDGVSKYATIHIPNNMFFGGGLNEAFRYFLKHQNEYDNMIFMNSDIVVYGLTFVRIMRDVMYKQGGEVKILSPCITSNWNGVAPLSMHKHMNNWGAIEPRYVKYVDFQCPMFDKEFIKHVKQFDSDLMFGIGQDHLSGIICEEQGWKIAVVDWCPAYHEWAYTIRNKKGNMDLPTFAEVSNKALGTYAKKKGLQDKLQESFEWGATYEYSQHA